MKIGHALPFMLLAEASTASQSWIITLLNYGVAGVMLLWFMWRDKVDRQERNDERKVQQQRHEENLESMKKIQEAYRMMTDLLIVGFGGMKQMDTAYTALLEKIKTNGQQ
jgi:Na+/melibiose symporter-like transporter